jgi:hypothetical protein
MKKCTCCNLEKDSNEFYKDKSRPDGMVYQCKSCLNPKITKWSKENRDKRRMAVLKSATGVTSEQYKNLLNIQNNECAICQKSMELNKKYLAVDHNHSTGVVRGLLCNTCNVGLGYFRDNLDLLFNAINYLKNPVNDDCSLKVKI